MGTWHEHFHCVDLESGKASEPFVTRHGAAYLCHELNAKNPAERWTVKPCGMKYIPDYYEQLEMRRT